jgi:AcrR family transcriptional regulator
MAKPRTSPHKQRIPLNRERVLRAAVALADEEGIESLTMRKLAQALGVEAMSLYYHVANKDDMLDGMIDIVVGEIDLPAKGVDWQVAMRRRAVSAHQVFSVHPWAGLLMESRTNPGPNSLQYYDSILGCLLEAGFPIAMAASAFSALDAYIYGFGLQEMSLPFDDEQEAADVAEELLEHFPADDYPSLFKMITDHVLQPGYDYAAEFEIGLDLILDGFARLRAID